MTTKTLSEKQILFCKEYIKHWNACKAYRDTYPNCKTDHAATVSSTRLMAKPEILSYISELKEEVTKDYTEEMNEIIQDLHNTVRADLTEAYQYTGSAITLKEFEDMPPHIRKSITKIKTIVNEDGSGMLVDVSFECKTKARDQLMRYHSKYNDKIQLNHKSVDELIMGNKDE